MISELNAAMDGPTLGLRDRKALAEGALVASESSLFDWIAALIRSEDADRLTRLRDDDTPVHAVLAGEYARPEALESFRVLAGLGRALLEPGWDDLERALVRYANSHALVAPESFRVKASKRGSGRLDEAVGWLATEGAASAGAGPAQAVAVTLRELAGDRRRSRLTPQLTVVADNGSSGTARTLSMNVLPGFAPCLLPDPRRMPLFAADKEFEESLHNAWLRSRGARARGTVLWSLSGEGQSVDWVEGPSFGLALSGVADDVRRRRRRVLGSFTVLRTRPQTVVIGGVLPSGGLKGVGGYAVKLPEVAAESVVVLPKTDMSDAMGAAKAADSLDLVGADTWRKAIRAARIPDRRARLRSAVAVIAVVATTASVVAWRANVAAHNADLNEAAGRVAQKARDLGDRDPWGTGLLLAMVSDDLAAQAHRTTRVFDEVARDAGTLIRVVRPTQGSFSGSAVSPEGNYALLRTDIGEIMLVRLADGKVLWSRAYPPGISLAPRQTYVTAMVFADEEHAAFATSDRKIVELSALESGWRDTGLISVDVPSARRELYLERNTVDRISFAPESGDLLAYGSQIGLLGFASGHERFRCTKVPTGAAGMRATRTGAVLLTSKEILEVRAEGCRRSTLAKAGKGENFADFTGTAKKSLTTLALRDDQLIVTSPGKRPRVLADDGPFTDMSLSDSSSEGIWVNATTSKLIRSWRADGNDERITWATDRRGTQTAVGHYGLIVTDGAAVIHEGQGAVSYSQINNFGYGLIFRIAWSGHDLLLGGSHRLFALPDATSKPPGEPIELVRPTGTTNMPIVEGAPGGRWAGAILIVDRRRTAAVWERRRTAVVWDVRRNRMVDLALPAREQAISLAFGRNRLYIGFSTGRLRSYEVKDGAWRLIKEGRLAQPVLALGTGPSDGEIYAVTGAGSMAQPTAVRVKTSSLVALGSKALPGAAGLPQILGLRGGAYAAAYGSGRIVFLDRNEEPTARLDLPGIFAVSAFDAVPGGHQVVVSGMRVAAVVDTDSQAALDPAKVWGSLGAVGLYAATADGDYFAAANFFRAGVSVNSLNEEDRRRNACRAIGRNLSRGEWRLYVGDAIPYRKVCDALP